MSDHTSTEENAVYQALDDVVEAAKTDSNVRFGEAVQEFLPKARALADVRGLAKMRPHQVLGYLEVK